MKWTALWLCSTALTVSAASVQAQSAVSEAQIGSQNDFARKDWESRQAGRRGHHGLSHTVAAQPTTTTVSAMGVSYGGPLVAEARRYLGTNPTGRSSLWCGAFMDMVLKRTGHKGGGNLALGYAKYGRQISGPQIGAIAVISRGGGGHVGVVSGIDPNGNPIVVSGNHNDTVAESVYPRDRIITYVMPN
jgi:uncharacterized protein (TIGR02594 family)